MGQLEVKLSKDAHTAVLHLGQHSPYLGPCYCFKNHLYKPQPYINVIYKFKKYHKVYL